MELFDPTQKLTKMSDLPPQNHSLHVLFIQIIKNREAENNKKMRIKNWKLAKILIVKWLNINSFKYLFCETYEFGSTSHRDMRAVHWPKIFCHSNLAAFTE